MPCQEAKKQRETLTTEETTWIETERSKDLPTYNFEDIAFAYARLAKIFQRPITSISAEHKFGRDLRASINSFFRRNEIDQVRLDLEDVAVDLSPELQIDYDTAITVLGYVTVMCKAALLARKHLHRELSKSLKRLR